MSFSRSFRGAPLAILALIAAFPAEQRAADAKFSTADSKVPEDHEKQIQLAERELAPILHNAPTDVEHEVQIWGHANLDGSGTVGWSLRRSPDAQTPAIEPTG